jgi:hypothetical protein
MNNTSIPWPTQQAIRGSMGFSAIVDINGRANPKTGGFYSPEDAINAGHKRILIRKGTYGPFSIDQDFCFIQGEGSDTIIDGSTVAHAIEVSKSRTTICNLQVKTTPGGGNGYDGIKDNSGGFNLYERIWCTESDDCVFEIDASAAGSTINDCIMYSSIDSYKVYSNSSWTTITGCYIGNAGSNGVYLDGSADNSIIIGNRFNANTSYDVNITANAENCIVVANRCTGSGGILDSSGTSVVANNDQT